MSEIYGKPIEIYSYSNQPMRTFHEHCDNMVEPIRLSYHGMSHYNAVVPMSWTKDSIYVKTQPGEVEEKAILLNVREQQQETQKESEFAQGARLKLQDNLSLDDKDAKEMLHRQYRLLI